MNENYSEWKDKWYWNNKLDYRTNKMKYYQYRIKTIKELPIIERIIYLPYAMVRLLQLAFFYKE